MKYYSLLLLSILLWIPFHAEAQEKDSITFAVMGNSISTYYGYIPDGYKVFYTEDREKKYGIQVGDTWWMQLSRLSGLTFLANASWSGSRVSCDLLDSDAPFVSNARVAAVGRAGIPDIIFIMGGTNDWNQAKLPLGEFSTDTFTDSLTFRGAYAMLLHKLSTRYPSTKLVCLSITPRSAGVTQLNGIGYSQADANESIKKIAKQFGGYYIDCTTIPFSSNWSSYTLDKLHPTASGASLMANAIYKELLAQNIITSDLRQNSEKVEAECLLDLSFDANGIVNKGSYNAKVGSHGQATTLYDKANDTYYGCTKVTASDYFYALYDEGSPLSEAFNSSVTWETLVRLEGLADENGKISKTCFFGNEQDGGWSFYNSQLASAFTYRHESGVASTVKNLGGDSIAVSGKFYHLVVTMDRASHIIRYFINGKLVCTGTRAGTDMVPPQCGTVKGKRNMWICLGGNPTAGSSSAGSQNSSACSFIFARIYNGALTQKAAQNLYTDHVRMFTEPVAPQGNDLILDCQFTPDGALNNAVSYRHIPIEMAGNVPLQYNATIQSYEAQFNGKTSQFFKFFVGDQPSIMSQLSDAYSVEIYCQNSTEKPKASTRPLCFVNGYGFGLHMNSQGNICYTTTTQGNKTDGSYAKTQWSWIGVGSLTTDYTHYVIVYDRLHFVSRFYINGEEKAVRYLTFKECPIYEWAPSTWLAIGGDALGTYNNATKVGNYPFMGKVAMVRVWGKALTEDDVKQMYNVTQNKQVAFTTGTNGYATCCVPFVTSVPDGFTAYVVSEVTNTSVVLKEVASSGDILPQGIPVIMKGASRSNFTLSAIDQSTEYTNTDISSQPNYLVGSYCQKTITTGTGYYLKTSGNSMYRATTDYSLPACSCYLPSTAKRSLYSIEVQESEDIVPSLQQNPNSIPSYDLQGRRIVNTHKGISIKEGKKIITH